ncbi:penicillin-binding protein activator [Pseudomonadota bacterium]|nr:penicillin-binding protein activator [Pseudomonadota bacterium]
MTQRFLISWLTLITIGLSACQPTQPISPTRPDTTAVQAAVTAEQSGDFISAAQQYLLLAGNAKEQLQAQYYLRAARAFWQANNDIESTQALSHIDKALLSPAQHYDVAILEAELALTSSQPEQALAALELATFQSLSSAQQQEVLQLRIEAYQLTENWLEKANSHLQLSLLLDDESTIASNQQALWQSLMALTPQSLELFKPGVAPAVDSGWFELAFLVKSYQSDPEVFIVAIENWQRDYPRHPANPELYAPSLSAGTQLTKELDLIAVLLPETGPYKLAAQAIKQGIITAHFITHSNTKLRFYPVSTQPSNVWPQYQQAVSDKASIVIGPLDKRAVEELSQSNELTIPVLALNRLSDKPSYPNLFQFGLAPEDDAVSIANYASQNNYQRAVILSSDDNWGQRVTGAFKEQWLSNGGVLLNTASYNADQNDFSTTITSLLGLETSTQRNHSLKRTLGRSLEFEPRRRQDIDFVFLAAKPLKARQLVPQLKFHRSGNLPIITTSQAYSGREDSQQDIDLNNLIITDIPWVLEKSSQNDPVYNALKISHPTHFDSLVRLYALGADAYRIIPQLNGLSRSSDISFSGATGTLSIDSNGRVNRDTSWGQFHKGILNTLEDNE